MAESIKKFIIKDAHGGTKESGSFSVVGEVHVDIVPGYGEPYADSEYVNGILTITIHNIEGNGITEITTDSQEGDEAVNTVTIKTNANPEGVVLEVRNGSKGETGPQGPQGIPGQSVIVGEGDLPLENYVSQADNKAVTPKAVYDELQKVDRKIDYGDIASETSILTSENTWGNNRYFNSSGQSKTSKGWKACADIYVSEYDFIRVSLCEVSSAACIIFIDANNQCIVDASIPGAGTSQAPYYREIVVKVPANAVRLGISAMIDEQTYGSPYCYGQKMSGGIIKANETREILDKDRLGEVQVVKAPGWVNGYIGSDGQGHLTNDYWLTTPIKADKIYSIKSTAETPPYSVRINYYNKDMEHLGLVAVPGDTEITTLVMECEYIRIWFDNDGTPPDTQLEIKKYVGGNAQYPRLDGKAIVTFGDSITWYDLNKYTNGDEQGSRVKGYQSYMRDIGMMVDNQGISGYTMPQIYNKEVVPYERFGVVDYVTIFAGANDSKNLVQVGEVAEIGSTFDTATYIGALQAIIEHILNINTQVKIVLFTPIKGWVYQSGKPPMTKREYVDAVKAVGKVYSLPVIDIYDTIGLSVITRDVMINDPEPPTNTQYSLHPSTYGYSRMADIILPQLAQV